MKGEIRKREYDDGAIVNYAVIKIEENNFIIAADNLFVQRYINCSEEVAIDKFFKDYNRYISYEIAD